MEAPLSERFTFMGVMSDVVAGLGRNDLIGTELKGWATGTPSHMREVIGPYKWPEHAIEDRASAASQVR
jgi:hypothetical protein